MKRSLGIPLVALAHLVCSWVMFSVSVGIGMNSFDSPHALTATEKLWTAIARMLLRPIADPLQRLSKALTAPVMTDPGYGVGVRSLTATVWFFGPLVLNSVLWAALIWLAYSGVARRFGRVRAA